MTLPTRNHWPVPVNVNCLVMVMRLVIIFTALFWLIQGWSLWFAVGATSASLTFLPSVLVHDRTLRIAAELCMTILLLAHVVLGMQIGLYETSTVYDKLIHVLGSSAIAGLSIVAILQYSDRRQLRLPLPLLLVSVLGIVVGLGTLWELFEFAIDRTGLFRSQRGLDDTMLDLVADAIGALAALGVFIGLVHRKARLTPGYPTIDADRPVPPD